MKLTKEEIKFIDNYLKKNDVKFWDVRLELLDHIVSAVEDKIGDEGISFNEALLEVHCGFGNQLIKIVSKNMKSGQKVYIRVILDLKNLLEINKRKLEENNVNVFGKVFQNF